MQLKLLLVLEVPLHGCVCIQILETLRERGHMDLASYPVTSHQRALGWPWSLPSVPRKRFVACYPVSLTQLE